MNKTTSEFKSATNQVVVVRTSAGGYTALIKLICQLTPEFPAPVLIVQYISADASGDVLLDALNRFSTLKCVHALNDDLLQNGVVYLAPSDHHLMVAATGRIRVTKGAQEKRSRPAIDPLFRSAAVAFGNRTIAIILTGYLDNGTAGLIAVKRCGGVCIVQDPKDASYPNMPSNALNQVKADYCVPIIEMGGILTKLMARKLKKQKPAPEYLDSKALIAERVISDLDAVNALGDQVPFKCPVCGGVL